MAQSKSSPSNRPNRPGGKPGSKPAAKVSTTKPAAAKDQAKAPTKAPAKTAAKTAAAKAAAKKAPPRKPGKSIVNQKQTPWGLIIATVAIVIFAAAVIVVVIATRKDDNATDAKDRYRLPEVAAAKAIKGVVFKVEPNHNHVDTAVKYDTTPPTGGNHSQIWADCTGTVYANAIANENAVHMLEHGAVWITYRPGLAAAEVTKLAKFVTGVDRMALSPYPDLKTPISLQAWGYQLFVNSADDPRIAQFIAAVRLNPNVTPEYGQGVTCADPQFKAKPSTFGNPIFTLG